MKITITAATTRHDEANGGVGHKGKYHAAQGALPAPEAIEHREGVAQHQAEAGEDPAHGALSHNGQQGPADGDGQDGFTTSTAMTMPTPAAPKVR